MRQRTGLAPLRAAAPARPAAPGGAGGIRRLFSGSGRRIRACAAAALLASGLLAGVPPRVASCQPIGEAPRTDAFSLVISDRSRAVLGVIGLNEGRFSHVFVHSFHLTPVEERFEVVVGKETGIPLLHLYELVYQSSGVGMPADAELGYRLENGRFFLTMDRSFEAIPLMVSTVPGHGVTADGVFHPFTEWAPERSFLILEAGYRQGSHVGRSSNE